MLPSLVLGTILIAHAANADVTAVFGCRFYVDGRVFAEFRINEIDHTDWADEATFDPPSGKPRKVDVKIEGEPGQRVALRFRMPNEGVEIRVSDELKYVNASYFGPIRQNLSGECEQADNARALTRWFAERERQHRRHKR